MRKGRHGRGVRKSKHGNGGGTGRPVITHILRQSCRSRVAPLMFPSAMRACDRRFHTSASSGMTLIALLKSVSAFASCHLLFCPARARHVPRATSAWYILGCSLRMPASTISAWS